MALSLRSADTFATIIDVLIRPVVPFEQLRQDAILVKVGELTVPIASIEHLIVMKTGTGRSRDALDIEELRKLRARRSGQARS